MDFHDSQSMDGPLEEEDPWMLESDFIQEGGQADAVENEPEPDVSELYDIIPYNHQRYTRYCSGRLACSVQFRESRRMNNVFELAPKIWDQILDRLFSHLDSGDKIGVSVHHPSLTDPIHIPLTAKETLNGEKISNKIAKVQQSKRELRYGEEMRAVFIYSRVPKGTGFKRDYRGTVKEQKENHAGHGGTFITIKNEDNSCCPRAIITAQAKVDNDPKFNTIRDGDLNRRTMQKRLALELMQKAGLDPTAACGFPEIGKMQEVLGPLYQVLYLLHFVN